MTKCKMPEKPHYYCVECGAPVPVVATLEERLARILGPLVGTMGLLAVLTSLAGTPAPVASECQERQIVDATASESYRRAYAESLTVPAATWGAPPARAPGKRAELLDPFAENRRPDAGRLGELADPFAESRLSVSTSGTGGR